MKSRPVHYLLLIFIFLYSNTANAQNVVNGDSTNVNRVKVFNPSNTKDFFYASDNYKLAVKLNPILILFGEIPVYFEHRLGEKLSGEMAVGVTLRNYYLDIADNDNSSNTSEVIDNDKFGYSFRAALKFYPSSAEEPILGYYFAPEIMTRMYYRSFQYKQGFVPAAASSDTYNLKKIQTDFKILFGYQDYLDANILIDYYLGFGIRNVNMEESNSDINSPKYGDIGTKRSRTPVFTAGVKLGFAF